MTFASLLGFSLFLTPVQDDFAKLWDASSKAISNQYYARSTRKDEMEKLLAKYAPKAKSAKNRAEFSQAVNDMIDEFKDSHFDFLPDDSQGYYVFDQLTGKKTDMPNIGAWFAPAKDGYTVTMVLEGLPAAEAGLRKGDVIQSIEGAPFTPIASLKNWVDKEAQIQGLRDGKPLVAKVKVVAQPGLDMFLDGTKNSSRIIEHKGKKIGYIHLWTMANDDFRNALQGQVYGKLKDTDAMILDIRDGFGGRPEGFGDPFFRPDVRLDWEYGAGGMNMKQLFGYGRPLVVLINGGSRSAKEVFSAIIKKSGRGKLIGQTTAGHVLGTFPQRIADWAYLEIPMVDVKVDGTRIEGNGVKPDIEVTPEYAPDGTDRVLQEALRQLTSTPSL